MNPTSTSDRTRPSSKPEGSAIRLEVIETYRKVPIFRLAYERPVSFNQALHAEEIRTIAAIPEDRFAVVISLKSVSFDPAYSPEAQAETYRLPECQQLQDRLVAVARYEIGSFSSLIRTMLTHLSIQKRLPAELAMDIEGALRAVRKAIDRHLKPGL